MKTTILSIAITLLFFNVTYSQNERDYVELVREVLSTEKKVAVAEVMQFTNTESGPFWELYNEYNFKLSNVHNQRVAVIFDFAENYEKMTDEKADEIWSAFLAYKRDVLKLQEKYYPKFKKILSAARAVRYLQLENKIDALINAELAQGIPLLEKN
jgi:hypothetical protein